MLSVGVAGGSCRWVWQVGVAGGCGGWVWYTYLPLPPATPTCYSLQLLPLVLCVSWVWQVGVTGRCGSWVWQVGMRNHLEPISEASERPEGQELSGQAVGGQEVLQDVKF